MAEPADDTRDRPSTAAEALAHLLDARYVVHIDRPSPTLDETLELFHLYYRQAPIERIGFMVLARIYARLDDADTDLGEEEGREHITITGSRLRGGGETARSAWFRAGRRGIPGWGVRPRSDAR